MTDLYKKLRDNYLLGYIKYKGTYNLYSMPLAWWILNYSKYDPTSLTDNQTPAFRDNILNVSDNEIESFIRCIEEDRVSIGEFELAIDIPSEYKQLSFFVDFDAKLFINGYFENVEPEAYLPDDNWVGEMGLPVDHLPGELRGVFEK